MAVIKCNLFYKNYIIDLSNRDITNIKKIGVFTGPPSDGGGSQTLLLNNNDIININIDNFDIGVLNLDNCNIQTLKDFNNEFWISLYKLSLKNNNIINYETIEMLQWAQNLRAFVNPCIFYFEGNPASPIGTTFEQILLTKNVTCIY